MDTKNTKKAVIAGILVCSVSAAAQASNQGQSVDTLKELKETEVQSELYTEGLLIEEIKPGELVSEAPTKRRHRQEPGSWWTELWNSIVTGGKDGQFS